MLCLMLVNANTQKIARRKGLGFCVGSLPNMADPLTTKVETTCRMTSDVYAYHYFIKDVNYI